MDEIPLSAPLPLATTDPQFPVPIDEIPMDLRPRKKLKVKTLDTLGLSPRRWSKLGQKAIEEFGDYLDVKLTANVLLVSGFDSIEQVEYALKEARAMSQDPDTPVEVRAQCLQMIGIIAKAWVDMSKQIVALKEKANPAPANETPKGMNLPPTIPMQFQMQPGSQVVVGSVNSDNGQPPIDVSEASPSG